jgi:hypothetical protein
MYKLYYLIQSSKDVTDLNISYSNIRHNLKMPLYISFQRNQNWVIFY